MVARTNRGMPSCLPLRCAAAIAGLAIAIPAQKPPLLDAPTWHRVRTVWFGQSKTPTVVAEVCVGWEGVAADSAQVKAIDAPAAAGVLPLGAELWPVLQTFTELKLGGVEVKCGSHPFALQRRGTEHALVLFDGDALRKARVPVGKPPTDGIVAAIPLTASAGGEASPLTLKLANGDDGAITLLMSAGKAVWQVKGEAKGARGAFALDQPMVRACTRARFPVGGGGMATAVLDHGLPKWGEATEKAMAAMAIGNRWRFGNDWWTTLQTDAPLTLGGKKLAPGEWHLVVERTKNGWSLACCPAGDQLRGAVDAFAADRAAPTLTVPLTSVPAMQKTEELRAEFLLVGSKPILEVAFGRDRWQLRIGPG
jgi:hypothetical protein